MNNKLTYVSLVVFFQSCTYGYYGNGNKSRDLLIKPGIRWTTAIKTDYYLNGQKACEGKVVTYNPKVRGNRFVYYKGVVKYWSPDGNLVWKENYKFNKKAVLSRDKMEVINEMPDSLRNALDSLFYAK